MTCSGSDRALIFQKRSYPTFDGSGALRHNPNMSKKKLSELIPFCPRLDLTWPLNNECNGAHVFTASPARQKPVTAPRSSAFP
jgi:hypothetical protein